MLLGSGEWATMVVFVNLKTHSKTVTKINSCCLCCSKRNLYVRDTDSNYIKLAKQGGRKNLLTFNVTKVSSGNITTMLIFSERRLRFEGEKQLKQLLV